MMYCLRLPADKAREPLISSVDLFRAMTPSPPPPPFPPPPLPMLSLSRPAPVRLVSHPQLPLHMIRLLTAQSAHACHLTLHVFKRVSV